MEPRAPIIEPGAGLPHIRAFDGLRAIAVIAVMVYHHYSGQRLGGLSGGFLGVDLFFVLSGFLITGLLLVDHDRSGRVISADFWLRRARRLLPALLVLLLVVAVQTRLFTPSYLYDEVRRSAFATLLYVQNYWQLYSSDSGRTALDHTWSLSIEEQFYLLWPVLLAGLVAWNRHRPRRLLAAVAVAVLASSAAMALLFTPGNPYRVYQGLDTRAHQLLVGAGLAVAVRIWPPARGLRLRLLEFAALGALVAFGVLAFTVNFQTEWLYRGGLLALALGVAVILLAALHPEATRLHAVLGCGPLVRIGLISYGLYLFHIPVFDAIEPGRFPLEGVPLLLVRFGLTAALAVASYLLVEQPVRRRSIPKPTMRLLAPAAVVGTVLVLVLATSGATPTPIDVPERIAYYEYARSAEGRTRFLVIGDALAAGLTAGVTPPYRDTRTAGVAIGCSGGLAPGTIVADGRRLPEPDCGDPLGTRIERAVRHFSPEVVAFSAGPLDVFDRELPGGPLSFGSQAHAALLRRRLDAIRRIATDRGARFVVLSSPCMEPTPGGTYPELAPIRADATRVAWLNTQWRAYGRDRDVEVLDLDPLLCADGTRRHDPPWTSDGVGVNEAGARALWRWLGERADDRRPASVGFPRRPDDLT